MVINPFLLGILATIFVELLGLFTALVIYVVKTKRKR